MGNGKCHICVQESTALTQSLVLWDVFKAKDVPKNPAVTNSSAPITPCAGAVGISSQAWNTPRFGSRPKPSQGHLLPFISSVGHT